jgi:agmatinase
MDVVQFDSHLDFLDESSGLSMSHANPMKNIADLESVENITQIGIRGFGNPIFMAEAAKKAGSKIITAETALKNGMDWVIDQVPKAENIYVTIDIDALDPTHAPGTGTPEPGGFSYLQMREMLRKLPGKGKIIGFDVVEVNPLYDHAQLTALVAVRLIIDLLAEIRQVK